jgi:hypothetical protein
VRGGKAVYFYYERDPHAANIIPIVVKSFGMIPLNSHDITEIVETVGCTRENVTGYTEEGGAMCDDDHMAEYTVHIPGRVLLAGDEHDPFAVPVDILNANIPYFDMEIDLFRLQSRIGVGALGMNE